MWLFQIADHVTSLERDLHIIPDHPFALLVFKALHLPGALRILHRQDQIPLTAVVVSFSIHRHHALSLRVGLTGEDEDLQWIRFDAGSGNECRDD